MNDSYDQQEISLFYVQVMQSVIWRLMLESYHESNIA